MQCSRDRGVRPENNRVPAWLGYGEHQIEQSSNALHSEQIPCQLHLHDAVRGSTEEGDLQIHCHSLRGSTFASDTVMQSQCHGYGLGSDSTEARHPDLNYWPVAFRITRQPAFQPGPQWTNKAASLLKVCLVWWTGAGCGQLLNAQLICWRAGNLDSQWSKYETGKCVPRSLTPCHTQTPEGRHEHPR